MWPEPTTTSGDNVKAGVVDHNFSKWNTVIRPSSDFCWLQDNWTLECHLTLKELQSKRFLWFVLLFRLWYGRIINDKNNFTPYASFVGVIFKILAVYLAVICVFHSVTIKRLFDRREDITLIYFNELNATFSFPSFHIFCFPNLRTKSEKPIKLRRVFNCV